MTKTISMHEQLAVAADFLEEHGFSPEVLAVVRQAARPQPEKPKEPEWLNCFRVAVRGMPFGRMGGDVMGLTMTFDPHMIEYGLVRSNRPGEAFGLSTQVGYMVDDLRSQAAAAIMDFLEKRGHR